MAGQETDHGRAQDPPRKSSGGVTRPGMIPGGIPIDYQGLDKAGHRDQGKSKSSTPASIALDNRQHAAFALIKRVLMDEVAGNLHFQGARFTTADTDAICAKVRKLVGAPAGAAADKLDRLTKSVLGAMESGDRVRAQQIAASRTSDELAAVANVVGASPLWSAPTPAETGEDGPAELAAKIAQR